MTWKIRCIGGSMAGRIHTISDSVPPDRFEVLRPPPLTFGLEGFDDDTSWTVTRDFYELRQCHWGPEPGCEGPISPVGQVYVCRSVSEVYAESVRQMVKERGFWPEEQLAKFRRWPLPPSTADLEWAARNIALFSFGTPYRECFAEEQRWARITAYSALVAIDETDPAERDAPAKC